MQVVNNLSRRRFVEASAIALAGLGLAACSNNGASEGGSDAGSDTLKVGVMGPYTGEVAQYGLAVRNGAQLCFKQFNEAGGVNGKKLDLLVEDEKGDSTEAVTVYNKLVQDGVVAICGDVTSTPTIAVAQASVNDNMPCVTPSATAADVTKYGKNFFRATVTDPTQGVMMAQFCQKQGYKTMATIYNSGGDYEAGVEKVFVETAEKNGIKITSRQGYAQKSVDFNAQLTAMIATDPDALFCPNYYEEAGKIVTQARQLGYKKPIIGSDGWPNIVGGSQEYASWDDLEGCAFGCAFYADADDDATKKFVADYKAEYNETPTNFCALGYDGALIICEGLKKAVESGAQPGSDDFKQALIDAIASNEVKGVTGTIRYEGNGDPKKSSLILRFENKKLSVVDHITA